MDCIRLAVGRYSGSVIPAGADQATFEQLNRTWARDAKRVYCQGTPMRNTDRATFVVLSEISAKDKNHVFEYSSIVVGADAASYEVLQPIAKVDDETLIREYARDCERVYFKVHTIGKIRVVKSADRRTFASLGRGFGMDARTVFWEGYKLPKCTPVAWRYLGHSYSRGDTRVYYGNWVVEGADPATFHVMPAGSWARDANAYYQRGRATDPRELLDELRGLTVVIGTVVEASIVELGALKGCALVVRCDERLSGEGIESGGLFEAKHFGLLPTDPARWLGCTRIWFCERRGPALEPQGWRSFWPIEQRAQTEALLAEL